MKLAIALASVMVPPTVESEVIPSLSLVPVSCNKAAVTMGGVLVEVSSVNDASVIPETLPAVRGLPCSV